MKTFKLSAVVLILGLTLALSGNVRAAAPQYNYYTTGQGNGSQAMAINDAGQAVVNCNGRAYLWTLSGGLTPLGDLGGGETYGYAINNLGQIVGESYIDATTSHGFLWDGQIHDLGSLSGMVMCKPLSINNLGVVIGYIQLGDPYWSTFIWTQAGGLQLMDGLQPIDGGGYATTIKDDGRMVGMKNGHAWLWTAPGPGTDLGGLTGFGVTWAVDINQTGQVVGFAANSENESRHAFSWTEAGGLKDLGVEGRNSWASGINNQGYVVGWSDFQGDYLFTRGALWTPGGDLFNLDTLVVDKPLGVEIGDASDINQQGVIVGRGNNYGAAYMLVPNAPDGLAAGVLMLLLQ
jgi:probable HAF family extracellular repeat protein